MNLRSIAVVAVTFAFLSMLFGPVPVYNSIQSNSIESSSIIDSPTIASGFETVVVKNGDRYDGLNLVSLIERSLTDFHDYTFYTAILDMEGNTVNRFKGSFGPAKLINSTTVLVGGWHEIYFWNIYTNETTKVDLPEGFYHHDFEYNPYTDTLLLLREYTIDIDGTTYLFDTINEYDMDWNLLWSIDTHDFISHTQWCPYSDTSSARADITHSNTLFWDFEEDVIYFNSRNVNTFYKINHSTSEVLWGLGEYGNFTMYNIRDQEKDILFFHAHAPEKLNNDTFIIFDNDYHNQTLNENMRSRIAELQIDEDNMTARESWVWMAPAEYYSSVMGDADRLPNGNRLGTFSESWGPDRPGGGRIVEISSAGEIVWDLWFPDTEEYSYDIYRADRFRLTPSLSSPDDFAVNPDEQVQISWNASYNVRETHDRPGTYNVFLNETQIDTGSLIYRQFWQPEQVNLNLGILPRGVHNITLEILDEAGHSTNDTVLVAVGTFYITRSGPLLIEIHEVDSEIVWSGVTSTTLSYNLTANGTLISENLWDGEDIYLDLGNLLSGMNRIRLYLDNGTETVFSEDFWVEVLPAVLPVVTPSQAGTLSIVWNSTLQMSWDIYDLRPQYWSVLLNGSSVHSGNWMNTSSHVSWNVPTYNESLYNITIVAVDQAGHIGHHTTWLTIAPPSPPIIASFPSVDEVLWDDGTVDVFWEVHGGTSWSVFVNGSEWDYAFRSGPLIGFRIQNWQAEGWLLGNFNLTLAVSDSVATLTSTVWMKIKLDLGDPYADAVVSARSEYYLSGENALGAPDADYATIYLDYSNGFLTLDMGLNEEIINGPGADFEVIIASGNYSVFVSNSLDVAMTLLDRGTGTESFDLSSSDVEVARYVRIGLYTGESVELDAIAAFNFNVPDDDGADPIITPLDDLSIWYNQTSVQLTWTASDLTPWSHEIYVNGILAHTDYWNGSEITYVFTPESPGFWNVTLVVFDMFGRHASDTVIVEVRTLPNDGVSMALIVAGIAAIVGILLLGATKLLKRRRSIG